MNQAAQRKRAFTLMELSVSMAVLALLGVFLAQILSATGRATQLGNRMIDAAAQTRVAFARLETDFSGLIKRSDVDFQIANSSGARLLFLSEVGADDSLSPAGIPGANDNVNRGISIVRYRIGTHDSNLDAAGATRIGLLRGAIPVGWKDAGYFGMQGSGPVLRFDSPAFPANFLPGDAQDDVLAPGVLQFVVGYQLFPSVPEGGQVRYDQPPTKPDSPGSIDFSKVGAIVIGVAVLDGESLKLLGASEAATLSAKFGVPPNGVLPVAHWSPVASDAQRLGSNIPLPVRQSIRLYQRFYPVHLYGEPDP